MRVTAQVIAPNASDPDLCDLALFGGFKEILSLPFGPMKDAFTKSQEKKTAPQGKQPGHESPAGLAAFLSFQVYKNFKKAHGPMPTW